VHEKGYWHRTSHIWIINSQNQILCQRRSLLKDSNPGKWESFFGGHMVAETDYADNAVTELKEELDIIIKKDELYLFMKYKCESGKEFQSVFILHWDGNIEILKLEKDEIDQVKWMPIEKLYEVLVTKQNNDWSKMGYERKLLDYFKKTIE